MAGSAIKCIVNTIGEDRKPYNECVILPFSLEGLLINTNKALYEANLEKSRKLPANKITTRIELADGRKIIIIQEIGKPIVIDF